MRNIFSKKAKQERIIERMIVEANEYAKKMAERYHITEAVNYAYSRANPDELYDIRVTCSIGNEMCERYYTEGAKSTLFFQEGTWWRKERYLSRYGRSLKTYEEDSDQNWTKYEYNKQGLVVSEESDDGASMKAEYDSKGRQTHVKWTNAEGEVEWNKTRYTDHSDGSHEVFFAHKHSCDHGASELRRVTNKKGNLSLYYKKDTTGNWTEKKYDKNGNITSVRTSESEKNSDL
jgi:YD repeat-containing protein